MIDIKDLRERPEVYREAAKQKGMGEAAIGAALKADEQRRKLLGEVEQLRAELNVKGKPTPEQLKKLQDTKAKLAKLEEQLGKVEAEYNENIGAIPNLMAENTPEGGEEANKEVKTWGEHPKFDFELLDHVTLAEKHGWLDFERGAKIAGSKFYFLFGPLVKLEFAMTQWVLDLLMA